MTNKEIGLRVKLLRKKKGLSQEELAGEVGISQGYISFIERGERNIDAVVLAKIASFFNIPIGYFFGEISLEEADHFRKLLSLPSEDKNIVWKIVDDLYRDSIGEAPEEIAAALKEAQEEADKEGYEMYTSPRARFFWQKCQEFVFGQPVTMMAYENTLPTSELMDKYIKQEISEEKLWEGLYKFFRSWKKKLDRDYEKAM